MATNNALNNTSGQLTIDPGASGDSFVQFDINAVGEFRIGVDDTDDSFRMSEGSALGTNDTFIMTAAGERTMPLQPSFLVRRSSDATNVTGDGTAYTIDYNAEEFDQGGDFSGTTFTAPVDGKYNLCLTCAVLQLTSSHTSGVWSIVTSNRTFFIRKDAYAERSQTASNISYGGLSTLGDMDAADTATTTVQISGGTKVVDVDGAGTFYTQFSGHLQC